MGAENVSGRAVGGGKGTGIQPSPRYLLEQAGTIATGDRKTFERQRVISACKVPKSMIWLFNVSAIVRRHSMPLREEQWRED
jgi:hypothetical protein